MMIPLRPLGPGARLQIALVAAGLVASFTVAALAQLATAPGIPAAPGTAAGSVQLGKATVALTHAYAHAFTMFDQLVYQIVLTDGPIPPEALARELARGGQSLLKGSKLSGLSILVGPDGSIRNIVPYIGDLRGSQMLASAGSVDAFKASGTTVVGQSSRDSTRTMGQGWSYTASWNAAVTKP